MSEGATATVSPKVGSVVDTIKALTVMELVELKEALEGAFGVTAAAGMPMMMPAGGGGAAAAAPAEEKTAFDVVLKDAGAQKIQVIKAVRAVTNLGLKEAKDVVEGAPSVVKAGVAKAEADKIKAELEGAGAKVELK